MESVKYIHKGTSCGYGKVGEAVGQAEENMHAEVEAGWNEICDGIRRGGG